VVISNGVINLCADKNGYSRRSIGCSDPGEDTVRRHRTRQAGPGGGDPQHRPLDGLNRRGLPCAGWERMLREAGFKDIEIGAAVDTFGGSRGEGNAREFDVHGFPFLAWKME